MSVIYNRIGDLFFRAQGKFSEALDAFQRALEIIKRLADQDKTNAGWQNDLAVSYERNGDFFKARGELSEALKFYELTVNIRQELAQQDRSNTVWQRNLCVCYQDVGDVLQASGKRQEALDTYQKSLAICEQLLKMDTSNTLWQSDLSLSCAKVGDALVAKKDLSAALEAYERALIMPRYPGRVLFKQDKANGIWRRDVIASLCKVAEARILRKTETDIVTVQALLPEASVLAADYHGSDRQQLIDSINEVAQKLK
jgi:tetratricopeptide (TPR) repeat protein